MKRKLTTETDRDMVIGYINRLDISKLHTVEVLKKNANRSISQNSLYWLWLTCIESETGTERIDLHEITFKPRYIIPKKVMVLGKEEERVSTKDLDTKQFKEYLDKVQIFASTELSITLPLPEDLHWQEFYDYYIDRL